VALGGILVLGHGLPGATQLLQVWGNQAFRQQENWGLLSRNELQEGKVVVL
jgi:hypothetical protein